MENSFLNRSSLVLGILLAVSPIASAESETSALDMNSPDVLKNLLGELGKKTNQQAATAKNQRYVAPTDSSLLNSPGIMQKLFPLIAQKTAPVAGPTDSSALDDPGIMQKLFPLMAQKTASTATPADSSALNDPAVMASLLGVVKQSEQANSVAATQVQPTVLDDATILQGLLPLMAGSDEPESAEIFEPTPRVFSFNDTIPSRHGLVGFGFTQQSSAVFGEHTMVSGSMRYHVSDNWDALLGLELGVNSFGNPAITDSSGHVEMSKDSSFRVLNTGIGYTLLNGLTSFDGETYVPWKLNADVVLGEQFTGGSHGIYYGFGTSLQILREDYWIGAETRYFRVNDAVLNKVGTHRGLQWGLAVGFYY
jgi:hypothetical protein